MLTDDEIDALRLKHGRIKHLTYNGLEMVFAKPTRAQIQMHASALEDPQRKPFADEELARLLVKVPDRETFNRFVEEYPYAVKSRAIGTALNQLVGLIEDDEAKPWGSASMPNGSPHATTPAA
jgi:hypothetical protein